MNYLRDERVSVSVGLVKDVLTHPLHFFVAFSHVIFRCIWVVGFIELLDKESFYFILVPNTISIQI